jgi:hypothetical protein
MSGSGSTYFMLNENVSEKDGYWTKSDLKFIPNGVEKL